MISRFQIPSKYYDPVTVWEDLTYEIDTSQVLVGINHTNKVLIIVSKDPEIDTYLRLKYYGCNDVKITDLRIR